MASVLQRYLQSLFLSTRETFSSSSSSAARGEPSGVQVSILSPASHNGRLLPAPSQPAPNLHSPTILISHQGPRRLQKNTRNAASFQFRLPWSFPRCQQGCFWGHGSTVLAEQRCVRAAGFGWNFGANGFVQFQIQLQRPRLPACFAAGPFTRVHHT